MTGDADLVVEGASEDDLRDVFEKLGFQKGHRHWVREELFVEVPSTTLTEPTQKIELGALALRVKGYAEESADFTAADLERDLERLLNRSPETGERQ